MNYEYYTNFVNRTADFNEMNINDEQDLDLTADQIKRLIETKKRVKLAFAYHEIIL